MAYQKRATPHGGRRPGSGRKKGSKAPHTMEKLLQREALRQRVFERWFPIIDAQIAAAEGVKYAVARDKKTGKFVPASEELFKAIVDGTDTDHERLEIWDKPPNINAAEYLINQAIDKPQDQEQTIEHTGGIVIRWKGEE